MNEDKESQSIESLPETSLMNIIARSDLKDLGTDLGEVFFDQLIREGIVRDVPVLGSILKLAKLGIDINNYLFLKKVTRFLFHIKDIPQEQRQMFVSDIQSDENLRRRVGENLVLLLNRLDDMQKTEFLSLGFKAYIEGKINYSIYQSLGRSIDRVKLDNLKALVDFYHEGPSHNVAKDDVMQDLQMAGLVNFIPVTGMIIGPVESYVQNELGTLFIELFINEITKM